MAQADTTSPAAPIARLQHKQNISARPESLILEAIKNLFRNRSAVIGMTLIGILILIAIFAPQIATHDPILSMIGQPGESGRLPAKPPCIQAFGCEEANHYMGLDLNARDLFSRVVFGARTSLVVGVTSVVFSIIVGTLLGLVAGFNSGALAEDRMGRKRLLYCFIAPPKAVSDQHPYIAILIRAHLILTAVLALVMVVSSVLIKLEYDLFISLLIFWLVVVAWLPAVITALLVNYADEIIMRLMDVLLAFPSLLLAIAIVTVLGPGLQNALMAIAIVSIPVYARLTRASVLMLKGQEFVTAERAIGAEGMRILFLHILPNALTPLIVAGTLGIGTAVLDAAALSFLGLGAQPPTPEWGQILSESRNYVFTAPHLVFFPGIAIMITVLGFNLLGDGMRDALDPRLNRI
jgi:ABC-type dipeptide/oligopeptide/nickel transport system permease subunit